jgi:hypothetical protein
MDEMEKCLVPGGMVVFIDVDHEYDQDQITTLPAASEENPNGSWWQRIIFGEIRHYISPKGLF